MKKISTTLLITTLLLSGATYAQTTQDDQDDRRKRYQRGTRNLIRIDLGTNNYLEDGDFPDVDNALYSVKPFGSWYVGLNSINRTHVGGPLHIEWGGGISWYNFKFENAAVRIDKLPNTVFFFEDPRDISTVKSKLTASFVNISLVPLLDFGGSDRYGRNYIFDHGRLEIDVERKYGFRIGIGGYAGYRLTSHSKAVYKEDGDRERDKERSNFFIENIRYGARLQLGIGRVDLFANYDLNEFFSDNRGPELNAFSFGVTLF